MKIKFTCQFSSAGALLPMLKGGSRTVLSFLLLSFFFTLFSKNLLAQTPTVLGTQAVNGGYSTYDLNTVGGFKQYRLQATSGAGSGIRNWEFAIGTGASPNYATTWRSYGGGLTLASYNTFIAPVGGTASALLNNPGGASGLLPAVTANNYYTFNISNNNLANNNMAVLETSFNPTAFVSSSQYPAAPTNTSGVTVNATMAAAPNAGENVFVRYSTDNFVTSTIVQLVFSGAATGRATIPVFATGTTVQYYYFSSPAAAGTPTHATADMLTLNLLNNAGANYQYTVAGAFSQYERNSFSAAYNAITTLGGATSVVSGTATTDFSDVAGVANVNDGAALIPLPFAFNFGGTGYTAGTNYVNISTNGFLSFVTANSNASKLTSNNNELLYNTGTVDIAIAGWWDDLRLIGGSVLVLYQTQGTTPNRTFTVQYTNVTTYSNTSTSTINFQVILYETSHAVELRYGTVSNLVHNSLESASIGVEWGGGGIGNMVDAVSGSKTLGCSMNNSEQYPKLNYRFFPVAAAPTPLAAGSYNVGTGQVYTTLSEAIADLNHRGVSGAVTLNCVDATYDASTGNIFPLNFGVIPGASATNTVTVQGNGAAVKTPGVYTGNILTTNGVVTMASGTDLAIVNVAGTDYLTFRNFSLGYTATFPASILKYSRGLLVFNTTATDGATNNIFRDLNITLTRAIVLSYGIYQRTSATVVPSSAAGANSNNKYYNLTIQNVYSGIWLNGNVSFPDLNSEIGTIGGGTTTIGGALAGDIGNFSILAFGIRGTNQSAVKIFNCEVRNVNSTSSTVTSDGILLELFTGANEIYNNKVHDINNSSITASTNFVTGIRFDYNTTGVNTLKVYNNFVYAITSGYTGAASATRQIKGIWSRGTGGSASQIINVDFNSVRIDGSAASNISSACFEIATTSGPVINCRNNIFANFTGAQVTLAKHYCAVSSSTILLGNTGSVWNRNMYYVANATNGFTGLGTGGPTDYASLANWQAAYSQDANSFGSDPQFVSATDLHINTAAVSDAESGGSYFSGTISWAANDIEADVKNTSTPDIGADEFDGCSSSYLKWTGTSSSDWNVAANWCSGAVPNASTNVLIPAGTPNSPSISTANAVAASVLIKSGATLSMSGAFDLSISAAGTFTNNGGTFSALGSGAVIFLGAGTINGSSATSFKNVIINGNLTVTIAPTFNGNFQINSGTVSAAPNYVGSSTLIYNTGAITTVGNEWTANLTSGTGVPQNVTIGNGANTTLSFGASASFWQDQGDMFISAGSTLTISTAAASDLRIGGNWTNNGTLTATNRLITFNGPTNATIGGSSATAFGQFAMNKGASIATTLDVNSVTTITGGGITTLSNGLLRINATGSMTKAISAGWTISASSGLHINGGAFSQSLVSLTNAGGLFRITSGTGNIGSAAGNCLFLQAGSTFDMQGGTLTIASRFENTGAANISFSGGTMTVCTVGNTIATGTFEIVATSALSITGNPVIVFQNASVNATPRDLYIIAGVGVKNITGGTFQFGNASTPAASVFRMNSDINVYNVTLNATNNPTLQLDKGQQINGTLLFSGSNIFNTNGQYLTLSGPVTNGSGTYSGSTTSNLTINNAGAISGNFNFTTGAQNLGVLTIDRSGVPVTIGTDVTINTNGSTIYLGSTLNNVAATTLAISSGAIVGITIYGTLNVAGIFQLNAGGYVNGGFPGMRGPIYATGSYLIYNNGGSFIRNVEWGSNTPGAEGYPHHVIIQNGTTVNFTLTTTFDVGCGGNLSIGNPTVAGAGTLDLHLLANPYDLYVAGNIAIGGASAAGTLTFSDNIGSDLYLTGNWNRTATGGVNFGSGNGRAVFFVGATDASISASGGQTFPYAYLNKSTPAKKLTLNDDVRISYEISFIQGTYELAAKNTTIISTAAYTARVGVSNAAATTLSYSGVGRFIIERNVAALRSWRLITAPINSAQTMKAAWMEGAAPSTTSPLANVDPVPGYGTHISGPSPATNGFDETPQNNYSVKYYNGTAWIGTGIQPASTNISSQPGWMLFIRGDRGYPISSTTTGTLALPTTLRTTGKINIGTMPAITPSGFTVVGNPYASAVDFSSVTKAGTGDIFYVWDPRITSGTTSTTVGGWITMTRASGTSYTAVPAPVSGTIDLTTGRIESGAAFVVNSSNITSLTFQESDKTASNSLVFRPQPAVPSASLRTNLYVKNSDGSLAIFDGVMNQFDKAYQNEVTGADALKLTNFAENFAIQVGDKLLAIEKRNILTNSDTIFFNLSQLKLRNYTFEFISKDLVQPNVAGFLEDQYLKTKTAINMDGVTKFDFNPTTVPASYAKDRFRLVFRRSSHYTHVNAYVLNGDIAVEWKLEDELNIDRYEIERSTNAVDFIKLGSKASDGDSELPVSYRWLDEKPTLGEYYYRIKSISKNGVLSYSDIVKVKIVKGSPALYVFPNPVADGIIKLQLNDADAGNYSASLLSSNGQLISTQIIAHAGGTATKEIHTSGALLSGTYQLKVMGPDKKVTVIKVVVKAN